MPAKGTAFALGSDVLVDPATAATTHIDVKLSVATRYPRQGPPGTARNAVAPTAVVNAVHGEHPYKGSRKHTHKQEATRWILTLSVHARCASQERCH